MVTLMQIAGISLTAVLLAKLLERYAKEQAMLLTLLLGTMITGSAVITMTPILNEIDALLLAGGLDSAQTVGIGKAIGICCITQLACDVCKDAGESALASGILLAGKTALLRIALPLVHPLLSLLQEVLSCIPS